MSDWQPSRLALALGIERLGGQLSIRFFEEDFDAAFGFFELLLAFARKGDAFFKEFHSVVEGELRAFEAADDFFEADEGLLEIGLLRGLGLLDGS
jgi:hypothetical protein